MEIKTLRGRETLPHIQDIARLRLTIFREYPYLYDGTSSGEEKYLQIYAATQESIFVLAVDNGVVVGAVTGLPLLNALEPIKSVFEAHHLLSQEIFYLGEILLLPEYRGQGLESTLYQAFEKALPNYYKQIALCEVIRNENDPRQPTDYQSRDKFWIKTGFTKQDRMVVHFSWKELDQEKSDHPMAFWMKKLN